MLLEQIHGIGRKRAEELKHRGIQTISQLRKNTNVLNNEQKIGLKYHSHITKPISRRMVEKHITYMKKIVKDPKLFGAGATLAGSYRRGEKTMGDIDLVITSHIKPFVKKLDKYVLECLSSGSTKWAGIVQLPGTKTARRLDIIKTVRPNDPSGEYWFTLLYFTGSRDHNIKMRRVAQLRGYKMDQSGLYNIKTGRRINARVKNERDIFNFLNITYKPPHARSLTFQSK